MFERDWSKFKHKDFIMSYFSVDKPHTLKIHNNNMNL